MVPDQLRPLLTVKLSRGLQYTIVGTQGILQDPLCKYVLLNSLIEFSTEM